MAEHDRTAKKSRLALRLARVPGLLDPRLRRNIKSSPEYAAMVQAEAAEREMSGAEIAASLGTDLAELARLYGRAGRLASRDLARRAEIDAALLALVEHGNLTHVQIGEALGWPIKRRANGSECRKLAAALRRASN